MAWIVEYTDEFGDWWDTLADRDHISLDAHVRKLEERGPHLPFPYSSSINGSRHAHMRELRVQSRIVSRRVVYECGLARDHRPGLA
jgi:hypothetical protein